MSCAKDFTPIACIVLTHKQCNSTTVTSFLSYGHLTGSHLGWTTETEVAWTTEIEVAWTTEIEVAWTTEIEVTWTTEIEVAWTTETEMAWPGPPRQKWTGLQRQKWPGLQKQRVQVARNHLASDPDVVIKQLLSLLHRLESVVQALIYQC